MEEWEALFRSVILDRGYEYYLDDRVNIVKASETEIVAEVDGSETYTVEIGLQNGNVDYMECDCPYAEDGNYCKHMAATLYQYFEDNETTDNDCSKKPQGFDRALQRMDEERAEAEILLEKVPEDEKNRLLINLLVNNSDLKNTLKLKYDFQMDAKQMLMLKYEIQDIVNEYSVKGFVDWNNAFDFCCSLENFLDERVETLIEKNFLQQAFELNNQVFKIIGTVDMDDSDGGSGMVAENCYEKWLKIYRKANETEKEKIKRFFLDYEEGALFDYIEEFLFEFRENELASIEEIRNAIRELDKCLATCNDSNDCGYIYSVARGHVSVIEKRIEYMNKLGATEEEIASFCKQNRHFYVVRQMEINDALENGEFEKAVSLLKESKELDRNNKYLLEEYSSNLIDLYEKTGNKAGYVEELKYNLLHCRQRDAELFKELRKNIHDKEAWNLIAEDIIEANKDTDAVYAFLNEEKRYDQMMEMLEKSQDIFVMEGYVKILSKKVPDRVIQFYAAYVTGEMKCASSRKHYRKMVQYLKTISFCPEGMKKARQIAENWKAEYRRRTALLDELRRAGF